MATLYSRYWKILTWIFYMIRITGQIAFVSFYLEKRMLQWLRCSWSFTRIPHTHSLPQTQVNQLQSHSILLRSLLSQTYLYIFHIFHLLSYETKQFTLQFKVEVERDITYRDQINGFRLAVGIKWERWVDDNCRDTKKDNVYTGIIRNDKAPYLTHTISSQLNQLVWPAQ